MATLRALLISLFLFFFLFLSLAAAKNSSTTSSRYLLPIVRDRIKLQYYTSFQVGTPPVRVYLSVDLSNQYNWFNSNLSGYSISSSYRSVPYPSPACTAYSGPDAAYSDCSQPPTPICNHNQCQGQAYTFASSLSIPTFILDPLVEDLITLYTTTTTSASSSSPILTSLPNFPFTATADTQPLKGLSQFTKGILTLSNSPISLHTKIANAFNLPRKFALCLPSSSSSNGAVYFGGGPYFLHPAKPDLSSLLVSANLVPNLKSGMTHFEPNDPSIEYYVNVNSIEIDGTPLNKLNASLLRFDSHGNGGTKLSTMSPYTRLHSDIYPQFVELFASKAQAKNVTRVGPVSSFKACFASNTVAYNAKTGAGLPVIHLVLDGGKRWTIYGANSMVRVSTTVSCLAFLDATAPTGKGVRAAIVIGGKQMEDNLLEFDLDSSKVGYSSSLLRFGTTCSQFKGI